MNKVILLGNLCKDIQIRYTESGKGVIQNTLAVRNDYKNENGVYDSQFINIVAWEQTAKYINEYATKGSRLLISGRLTTRIYTPEEGEKRYITEVIVEKAQILDTRKKNEGDQKGDTSDQKRDKEDKSDPFREFGEQLEITEEELPF